MDTEDDMNPPEEPREEGQTEASHGGDTAEDGDAEDFDTAEIGDTDDIADTAAIADDVDLSEFSVGKDPDPVELVDDTVDTVDIANDPSVEAQSGTLDEFAAEDPDEATEFSYGSSGDGDAASPPPPPASPTPAPVASRLERDPFATFGGVASGIAHRYGWDVAVTRLAVFALFILSGGFAIPVYLLAWIIIPRATYWPPAGQTRSRKLAPRDIGIGLLAAGTLVALAIGGGQVGVVLVPLALVGGGIWLLVQNPRPEPALAGGMMLATDVASPPIPPAAPPMAPPQPAQPAPKRSRFRRVAVGGLIAAGVLALIAAIAIPLLFFFAIKGADIDLNTDRRVVVRPDSVVDIPPFITEESGTLILDLTDLEPSMFAGRDVPLAVVVDVDLGEIEVIVPADLRVTVDASSDLGQVTVFGSEDDGIGPDKLVTVDDAHLDLLLDTGVGEVNVRRG